MSSNYTFCGYDMQDPNSKAGRGNGDGINLNSVTAQYMLRNNPDLAKMVYEGQIASSYGNGPTVSDGGTATIDQLPTVAEIDEKGNVSMNPMELAQSSMQLPTVQFGGALYRDAAQPTAFGTPMPMMGYGAPVMQNGCMPINYTPMGYIPYNYNPAYPMEQLRNPSQFNIEWNDYQRRQGFRAPIPTDTDFPEFGLLSGFHRGFDPHAALAPGGDDFYDPTMGARHGIAEWVHEQALVNASYVWGWQPGQVIDRREQMMFPGINEDHYSSVPSNHTVYDYSGRPQRRVGSSLMGPIPANNLPISNMVATNPFMAGKQMIGGYNMMGQQTQVPTPYMQARYNYAIANGFQSVQEMDNNDFRVLKRCSHAAHNDMTDEEFNEYFEVNWCKRFTSVNDRRRKAKEDEQKRMNELYGGQKVSSQIITKAALVKNGKILSGIDCSNSPVQYRAHIENIRMCEASTRSAYQVKQEELMEQNLQMAKDQCRMQLFNQAPERKYDHAPMTEFMAHGFVESIMYGLNMQDYLDRRDPKKRQKAQQVNQSAFLRNCLERGMGIGAPAAQARLAMENKMFYVNEDTPDEEVNGKQRGSYGKYPNGEPMELTLAPMFGYASYIPDPEHPERSIGFPRQFIQDIYDGYTRYCNAINQKSKSSKAIPMSYDEFQDEVGVRVMDDKEYVEKYDGLQGIDRFMSSAKRGASMHSNDALKLPPYADIPGSERDRLEIEDPTGDIPMDALLQDLEDNPD